VGGKTDDTPGSIYGGIPLDKTRVEPKDFEIEDDSQFLLKGGFHYGKSRSGVLYIPPRPLINHGVHRCKLSDTGLHTLGI
jgi:hypothetical protein